MEIWGILHFEMKVGEGGNDYWFLLNELLFQLLFSFYSVLLCSLTEHINVLGLFFFFTMEVFAFRRRNTFHQIKSNQ